MPQTATIKSLPVAFEMVKAMQAEGVEWGEDYRGAARQALAELLEGRMDQLIDEHLERMAALGQADRRNGRYPRWLLTELGAIELAVPRTRAFSALKVVSPATVSAVAKQLDAAVAAFHRRPLRDIYRVLVLDGVVLKRKTGAGALARPVLVALGLRPDGKKEVIDFRLASAESAAQWEQLLGDLVRRGLTGERLEMRCVDGLPGRSGVGAPLPNSTGQSGLLAALPTAFPDIPVQRCWAHKIRNVLAKVRKADQAAIKAALHRIMNATTLPAAWSAARRSLACPRAGAAGPVGRSLAGPLPQGGRVPAHRPRRSLDLLPLPDH